MKRHAGRLFLLKLATIAFTDGLLVVLVDSRLPDVTAGELLHSHNARVTQVQFLEDVSLQRWRYAYTRTLKQTALMHCELVERAGKGLYIRDRLGVFLCLRRCTRMTRSGFVRCSVDLHCSNGQMSELCDVEGTYFDVDRMTRLVAGERQAGESIGISVLVHVPVLKEQDIPLKASGDHGR